MAPSEVMVDDLDAPFWDGCNRGEFRVQRCRQCGRSYWPATCCIEHGGGAMEWVQARGRGVVHSFTVYHHAYDPADADRVPYVVAVVKLDEGPFFHTDLVECEPDDVTVGLPVEVVFDHVRGEAVPHFRPA